nr:G protein-coupled receptor [Proales similis]
MYKQFRPFPFFISCLFLGILFLSTISSPSHLEVEFSDDGLEIYSDEPVLESINLKSIVKIFNISTKVHLSRVSLQSETCQLTLSNKLDLSSFDFNKQLQIFLSGLKSIELNYEAPMYWRYFYIFLRMPVLQVVYIQYSSLTLEFNGSISLPCELSVLTKLINRPLKRKFLGHIKFFKSVRYQENTCAAMFYSAAIHALEFFGVVDSLIEQNKIGFQDLMDRDRPANLAHQIDKFELRELYRTRLTSKIFTKQMMNTELPMKRIAVEGIVTEAEPSLFRHVRAINYSLNILNLREFVQRNLKWAEGIRTENASITIILSQTHNAQHSGLPSKLELINIYDFRDEDFCLFKHYPVENEAIRFLIKNEKQMEITCTAAFLIQNSFKSLANDSEYWNLIEALKKINFTQLVQECNFEQFKQNCNSTLLQPIEQFWSIFDLLFPIELVKFIFAVVLHPIACLIGVALNLLSAWVIERMNKQEKKGKTQGQRKAADRQEKLFAYFSFNALFSAGFCLVSAPELLTRCVRFNGIYCSPFIATSWVRVYYLAGIVLVGNICKLVANMTQCSFTLYRYLINTDDGKSKWRSKFLKARPRNVAAVFLVIAIILTVPQLFFNEGFTIKSVTSLLGFDMFLYDHHDLRYFESSLALVSIYVLNLLFNEVVSTCFNLVADLKLLSFVRSVARNQKHLGSVESKEKEEVEKRLSKMIIFNGILSILFKTPEMVASLVKTSEFLSNIHQDKEVQVSWCMFAYSYFDSICLNLLSIGQALALFSFSVNFVLFLFFNSMFRRHLKKLFRLQ